MKVLVTGCRTYFSLPVIRELGRRGIDVTVADWDPNAIGGYSRYARRQWIVPRVSDEPRAFVAAVARLLEADPHDVVLPMFEETLAFARYRELLPLGVRLPLADYVTLLRVHDKRLLCGLARQAGVPIPETRLAREPWKEAGPFPFCLKVPQSNSARGVAVVRTRDEVEPAWRRLAAVNRVPPEVPALVQRFVDGYQLCTLSFAWHGTPKGTLVYRNLCEFPSEGGAGIARVAVRHAKIEAHVDRLLRAASWHGVVGFDFMVDRETGDEFLIDGNPRFTPATLLSLRSGLDLAGWSVAEVEPAAAEPSRPGLRTRIDPLVVLYCLRALLPQRRFLTHLKQAMSFLVPKRVSRSDLYDAHDRKPLVGVALVAIDALRALARGGSSALDLVGGSTYTDYEAPSTAPTAPPPPAQEEE